MGEEVESWRALYLFILLPTPSFVQQIFPECLQCVRWCLRHSAHILWAVGLVDLTKSPRLLSNDMGVGKSLKGLKHLNGMVGFLF